MRMLSNSACGDRYYTSPPFARYTRDRKTSPLHLPNKPGRQGYIYHIHIQTNHTAINFTNVDKPLPVWLG